MSGTEIKAIIELRRRIMAILAGQPPQVSGAILADLLAMLIAGHTTNDKRATDKLREDLLLQHIATVRALVPVNADIIHGRTP